MQQLCFYISVYSIKKVSTNEIKAKGLGQAFFPKGLRVFRGQSPIYTNLILQLP